MKRFDERSEEDLSLTVVSTRSSCAINRREERKARNGRDKTRMSASNLDLDDRGHVDMGRVAECQLVGCRRLRARWKHPQDLQLASCRKLPIISHVWRSSPRGIRVTREPLRALGFLFFVHVTQPRTKSRRCTPSHDRCPVDCRIHVQNALHHGAPRDTLHFSRENDTTIASRARNNATVSDRASAATHSRGIERTLLRETDGICVEYG